MNEIGHLERSFSHLGLKTLSKEARHNLRKAGGNILGPIKPRLRTGRVLITCIRMAMLSWPN